MNLQDVRTAQDWISFALSQKANTMPLLASSPNADQAMKNAISNLPRFDYDGNETGVIIYVGAEPSRFQEKELVICMYLWNIEKSKGDWWRGNLSDNFIRVGNHAGKTYMQNTIEILQKIGYDAYKVGNFSGLPQLVGQEIPIWIKRTEKDDKVYYNIGSIGSSFEVPASISLNTINLNAGAAPPAFGQTPQPQPASFGQQPQQSFGQQPQQAQFQQAAPQQQSPWGSSPYQGFGGNQGGLI